MDSVKVFPMCCHVSEVEVVSWFYWEGSVFLIELRSPSCHGSGCSLSVFLLWGLPLFLWVCFVISLENGFTLPKLTFKLRCSGEPPEWPALVVLDEQEF